MFEGKENFEQLKKLYSKDTLDVYFVAPCEKGKYEIRKTQGGTVNDAKFETEQAANNYLDLLIAFGYCRR